MVYNHLPSNCSFKLLFLMQIMCIEFYHFGYANLILILDIQHGFKLLITYDYNLFTAMQFQVFLANKNNLVEVPVV